ncbi:hypothetical protein DW919_02270 [Odoribacter splanchnicus]|nr:hypothetical protein DW919_02270 [Odoribacter splanchnicus]HCG21145.1 hypothetical protein [Odoribacter splanchnicus]
MLLINIILNENSLTGNRQGSHYINKHVLFQKNKCRNNIDSLIPILYQYFTSSINYYKNEFTAGLMKIFQQFFQPKDFP